MNQEKMMTAEDLCVWYKNYQKRLKIAEELGCDLETYAENRCCCVHEALNNEHLHLEAVARRLFPKDSTDHSRHQIFSINWWRKIGDFDMAQYVLERIAGDDQIVD